MQPHQGFAVTPLSHHDLRELTSARIAIETMTFRASVLHGSLDWETAAVAAHHRLARTPLHDPSDSVGLSESWADAHNQFHQALLAGCPNRRLLDIALRMREEAELYRRWSVVFGDEPERDIEGEHRLLVEAATARDADLAVERLSAHIAHTAELLITCAVDDHADAAPMVELGITP
jgi:DNA-binding GntR family transcriptional regulator